tara:strand:+ start:7396 stop:8286 length:891 start_codon:yes stop_codon:yes gene_type:complete
MNLKRKLYLLTPKALRKDVKNFYYKKLLHSLYELKHKFLYGRDFFELIALETTTYCNLTCSFCPNSKYDRGSQKNEKLMDIEIFKKIIDELATINYRGKLALFSYGEPFTDKRMSELISYTRKKLPRSNIQLNSNGFLMTVEAYKDVVEAGIDIINVSQYADIMPPNVKKVYEYLKTRPKSENKIKYRVFDQTQLSNRGGEIETENSVNDEVPICMYPKAYALTVDWKGNLILCCNDYRGNITFGNLGEKTLFEILDHSNFYKIMGEIKKNIYSLPICKKCVGLDKEEEQLVSIKN